MVWSLEKLAHYEDGGKLRLITDHSALKWMGRQIERQCEIIQMESTAECIEG